MAKLAKFSPGEISTHTVVRLSQDGHKVVTRLHAWLSQPESVIANFVIVVWVVI